MLIEGPHLEHYTLSKTSSEAELQGPGKVSKMNYMARIACTRIAILAIESPPEEIRRFDAIMPKSRLWHVRNRRSNRDQNPDQNPSFDHPYSGSSLSGVNGS